MGKEFSHNQDLEKEFLAKKITGKLRIFTKDKDRREYTIEVNGITVEQIAINIGPDAYAMKLLKKRTGVNYDIEQYTDSIIYVGGRIVDSQKMYEQYRPPYDIPEILKGYPSAVEFEDGSLLPFTEKDFLIPRPQN